MSHYDYFSPQGLAGPVEDLMAVGVKTVARSVGSSSNRDQAWDYFRFSQMGLPQGEKDLRIAEWRGLSAPFKAAMEALKPFMFFHAILTDLKDFKFEDKLRLQADLKSKFDAEWAKAFPASAQAAQAPASASTSLLSRISTVPLTQRATLLVDRPFVPSGASAAGSGMGPSSTGSDDGKNDDGKKSSFPVIPVAIGAAVLAVVVLMRKK